MLTTVPENAYKCYRFVSLNTNKNPVILRHCGDIFFSLTSLNLLPGWNRFLLVANTVSKNGRWQLRWCTRVIKTLPYLHHSEILTDVIRETSQEAQLWYETNKLRLPHTTKNVKGNILLQHKQGAHLSFGGHRACMLTCHTDGEACLQCFDAVGCESGRVSGT